MRRYPVNDAVMNACRYAATIARLKFQGLERGLVPAAASETATVTFIKIKDTTYAVTARHVIETLNNLARRDGNEFEGYSCVQSPGVAINGPFLTPPPDYPNPQPDIAICPVHEGLPGRIGKAPFEILPQNDAKWPVSHAVAIGFLDRRKTRYEGRNRRYSASVAMCPRAGRRPQVIWIKRPSAIS